MVSNLPWHAPAKLIQVLPAKIVLKIAWVECYRLSNMAFACGNGGYSSQEGVGFIPISPAHLAMPPSRLKAAMVEIFVHAAGAFSKLVLVGSRLLERVFRIPSIQARMNQ